MADHQQLPSPPRLLSLTLQQNPNNQWARERQTTQQKHHKASTTKAGKYSTRSGKDTQRLTQKSFRNPISSFKVVSLHKRKSHRIYKQMRSEIKKIISRGLNNHWHPYSSILNHLTRPSIKALGTSSRSISCPMLFRPKVWRQLQRFSSNQVQQIILKLL